VGSLKFSLESSDVGSWGMNTPAYFCIDNVGLKSGTTPVRPVALGISAPKIWPNPVVDRLQIALADGEYILNISNIQGQSMLQEKVIGGRTHTIDQMAVLPAGLYLLTITDQQFHKQSYRIVKR